MKHCALILLILVLSAWYVVRRSPPGEPHEQFKQQYKKSARNIGDSSGWSPISAPPMLADAARGLDNDASTTCESAEALPELPMSKSMPENIQVKQMVPAAPLFPRDATAKEVLRQIQNRLEALPEDRSEAVDADHVAPSAGPLANREEPFALPERPVQPIPCKQLMMVRRGDVPVGFHFEPDAVNQGRIFFSLEPGQQCEISVHGAVVAGCRLDGIELVAEANYSVENGMCLYASEPVGVHLRPSRPSPEIPSGSG